MPADGVDFVDEDDAGRLLLGLLEHVAHPRGADADEHLHEVGAGDGEERHLGFAGDGACQERLAGAGGTHHERAARDAAAQALELAGVAQELDELLHVFLGLVHPGDVGEGGLDLIFGEQPRLALAERHRPAAPAGAALHLAHEEHEHGNDDEDGEAGDQKLRPDALLLRLLADDLDVVVVEVVEQLGIIDVWPHDEELLAVLAMDDDLQPLELDGFHLPRTHGAQEGGVGHLLRIAADAEVVEDREQHGQDDEPQEYVLAHVVQWLALTASSASGLACRAATSSWRP